jgi:hypothetical protein
MSDDDQDQFNLPKYIALVLIIPSIFIYALPTAIVYSRRKTFPLKERSS